MTIPTTTRRVSPETLTEYDEYLKAVLDLAELAPELIFETTRQELEQDALLSEELPWRTTEGLAAEAAFFGIHAGNSSKDVRNLLTESLLRLEVARPGIDTLYRATLGYTTLIMLQEIEKPGDTRYDRLLDIVTEARNTSGFYLGILPQPVE